MTYNDDDDDDGNDDMPIHQQGQSQSNLSANGATVIYRELLILTDVDILTIGLSYVGFDAKRQSKVNLHKNLTRFKQFFGPDPSTVAPLFRDLRDAFPTLKYKDALMTLNWLFINDKQSVLSARWCRCEEYVGKTVKVCARMIQSLKVKKIQFVFSHNKHYKASVDCSNFETQHEFRLDPSSQWYDHKSNSPGLVSYIMLWIHFII